jgi:hypothetical protein
MAHVPGFDHDVFISYAHGDDRDWITAFVDRLKTNLARLLPGALVWLDEYDLRKSRNFARDIPANLDSSAVLISLVSPTYITRPYCVREECRRFGEIVAARKQPGQRFNSPEFAAELFGFRCPILPLRNKGYFNYILPGSTDLPFCQEDDVQSFPIGSPLFEEGLRLLLRELRNLLTRMRNISTPVLIYPRNPPTELTDAHSALTRELMAQSYRILPEDEFDPVPELNVSELAVLLLGESYDDTSRRLIEALMAYEKPFVVWPSPVLEAKGELGQRGFRESLNRLEYRKKTLLSPLIDGEKLKQEVFALLNPRAKVPPAPAGKPRVYLIYDSRQSREKNNAGTIAFHYRDEFHFEHSDQPRLHNPSLIQSDGVLLVWGDAPEDWCAGQFEQMFRLSNQNKSKGLCLFDPAGSKLELAKSIRERFNSIHVSEQFGNFDPIRLEPFFNPLRRLNGGVP